MTLFRDITAEYRAYKRAQDDKLVQDRERLERAVDDLEHDLEAARERLAAWHLEHDGE